MDTSVIGSAEFLNEGNGPCMVTDFDDVPWADVASVGDLGTTTDMGAYEYVP